MACSLHFKTSLVTVASGIRKFQSLADATLGSYILLMYGVTNGVMNGVTYGVTG